MYSSRTLNYSPLLLYYCLLRVVFLMSTGNLFTFGVSWKHNPFSVSLLLITPTLFTNKEQIKTNCRVGLRIVECCLRKTVTTHTPQTPAESTHQDRVPKSTSTPVEFQPDLNVQTEVRVHVPTTVQTQGDPTIRPLKSRTATQQVEKSPDGCCVVTRRGSSSLNSFSVRRVFCLRQKNNDFRLRYRVVKTV